MKPQTKCRNCMYAVTPDARALEGRCYWQGEFVELDCLRKCKNFSLTPFFNLPKPKSENKDEQSKP